MNKARLARELMKLAESLVKNVEQKAPDPDDVVPDASPDEGVEGNAEEIKARTVARIVAGLREAQAIVRSRLSADEPRMTLTEVPGRSMMQIRQALSRIASLRTEIELAIKPFEAELAKIEKLKALEKKTIEDLKEVLRHVREKGKYIAETEDAILTFTAFLQTKMPGVEQIRALPGDKELKKGEKAGELFVRLAEKLGQEIADKVEVIYDEVIKSCSHPAEAISGFKVIVKAGAASPEAVKEASLSDAVLAVKEWFSGATDALGMRIVGFAGSFKKWVNGFAVRLGIVKKNAEEIIDLVKKGMAQLEKLTA